jgi:hypothetical protein
MCYYFIFLKYNLSVIDFYLQDRVIIKHEKRKNGKTENSYPPKTFVQQIITNNCHIQKFVTMLGKKQKSQKAKKQKSKKAKKQKGKKGYKKANKRANKEVN